MHPLGFPLPAQLLTSSGSSFLPTWGWGNLAPGSSWRMAPPFQLCGSKGPSFEEWCSRPRPWHNESSPLFPVFFSSFLPISMVMQILGWQSFLRG